LQFNDHNCHYHSRSYYCQPTKKNNLYAWRGKPEKKVKIEANWYCVANINSDYVEGPFPKISYAMKELNKKSGSRWNRQMICGMTPSGPKKDPHWVGGKNQGGGPKSGFQKYWLGWADIKRMNSMCGRAGFCKANKACDTRTEVLYNGGCYYLDGSNGKCDAGYKLAPQSVFAKISKGFVGKDYKNQRSHNCCIKHRDQKKERQDYGMPRNCNSPGPFKEGPKLGAIGCRNAYNNFNRQLTVCYSQTSLAPPSYSYKLSGYNSRTCTGKGYYRLGSQYDCKKAALALGLTYSGSGSWSGQPDGCARFSDGKRDTTRVFYNHKFGKLRKEFAPICSTQVFPFQVFDAASRTQCPTGAGYHNINSASDCRVAAKALGLKCWGQCANAQSGSWAGQPPGCSAWKDGRVFFNTHKGKSNPTFRLLCTTEAKVR